MLLFTVITLYMPLHTVDAVYECISGMWGSQCTKTCGYCEGGNEFCHVYDGYCVNGCASGYKGTFCKETCDPGTYGQYCKHLCGQCSSARPICDRETGKCLVGCQPGYQMPYCNTPCPFDTWGEGCDNKCECQNSSSVYCGCDHVTGDCLTCTKHSVIRYYPVSNQKCLEEHMLFGKVTEYVPPDVLSFPYKPILTVGSTVALFVFGNFLWWWFVVRSPKPKETQPEIKRGKKPPKGKISKVAKYRKALESQGPPAVKPHYRMERSHSVDDGSAATGRD